MGYRATVGIAAAVVIAEGSSDIAVAEASDSNTGDVVFGRMDEGKAEQEIEFKHMKYNRL